MNARRFFASAALTLIIAGSSVAGLVSASTSEAVLADGDSVECVACWNRS